MTMGLPLSRPIRVRELNAERQEEIVATGEERRAIADAFGLVEVLSFRAELCVLPVGQGVFDLTGSVHADIVQTCVVTVEPVPQTVDETIDLRFVPEGSAQAASRAGTDLDPEAPDPPEVYGGETIDLGALAVEHFALGIDPYPRAPGVEFPQEGFGDARDTADSPFSALARLKRDGDSKP